MIGGADGPAGAPRPGAGARVRRRGERHPRPGPHPGPRQRRRPGRRLHAGPRLRRPARRRRTRRARAASNKQLDKVVANLVAGSGADQADQLGGFAVRYVLVQQGRAARDEPRPRRHPGPEPAQPAGRQRPVAGRPAGLPRHDRRRTSPAREREPSPSPRARSTSTPPSPPAPAAASCGSPTPPPPGWQATLDGKRAHQDHRRRLGPGLRTPRQRRQARRHLRRPVHPHRLAVGAGRCSPSSSSCSPCPAAAATSTTTSPRRSRSPPRRSTGEGRRARRLRAQAEAERRGRDRTPDAQDTRPTTTSVRRTPGRNSPAVAVPQQQPVRRLGPRRPTPAPTTARYAGEQYARRRSSTRRAPTAVPASSGYDQQAVRPLPGRTQYGRPYGLPDGARPQYGRRTTSPYQQGRATTRTGYGQGGYDPRLRPGTGSRPTATRTSAPTGASSEPHHPVPRSPAAPRSPPSPGSPSLHRRTPPARTRPGGRRAARGAHQPALPRAQHLRTRRDVVHVLHARHQGHRRGREGRTHPRRRGVGGPGERHARRQDERQDGRQDERQGAAAHEEAGREARPHPQSSPASRPSAPPRAATRPRSSAPRRAALAPGWTVQQTTEVAAGSGRGLLGTHLHRARHGVLVPGRQHGSRPLGLRPPHQPGRLRRRRRHRAVRQGRRPQVHGGGGHHRSRALQRAGPAVHAHRRDRRQTSPSMSTSAAAASAPPCRPWTTSSAATGWPAATDPAPSRSSRASPRTPPPSAWSPSPRVTRTPTSKCNSPPPSGLITPAGHETLHVKAGMTILGRPGRRHARRGRIPGAHPRRDQSVPVVAALRVLRGKGADQESAFIPATAPVGDARVRSRQQRQGRHPLPDRPRAPPRSRSPRRAGSGGGTAVQDVHGQGRHHPGRRAPRPQRPEGHYALTVEPLTATPRLRLPDADVHPGRRSGFTVQTLPDDRGMVSVPQADEDRRGAAEVTRKGTYEAPGRGRRAGAGAVLSPRRTADPPSPGSAPAAPRPAPRPPRAPARRARRGPWCGSRPAAGRRRPGRAGPRERRSSPPSGTASSFQGSGAASSRGTSSTMKSMSASCGHRRSRRSTESCTRSANTSARLAANGTCGGAIGPRMPRPWRSRRRGPGPAAGGGTGLSITDEA